MRYLALDIGTRRTGVAFLDTDVGIPLPLDTISHTSQDELIHDVMEIVTVRNIHRVVIGLPRLPSGDEGEQAAVSRRAGECIAKKGVDVQYVDERYTTPRSQMHKNTIAPSAFDGDAAAACELLNSIKTGL